jgi:hypothetical protein
LLEIDTNRMGTASGKMSQKKKKKKTGKNVGEKYLNE